VEIVTLGYSAVPTHGGRCKMLTAIAVRVQTMSPRRRTIVATLTTAAAAAGALAAGADPGEILGGYRWTGLP
jgi:hypothetical protein